MIIKWSDSYNIGVAKFDSQHKKLFALIGRLQEAMENGQGDKILRGILEELIAYTKSHFGEEEAAMQQASYPKLDAHKLEHIKLHHEVDKYYADLISGKVVFSGTILSFLLSWLKEHIAKSDKGYAPFLNPAKAPGAASSN